MKCLTINNLQISSSCTNSLIKNISYNISYNVYQMSMSIYRLTHKSSLYLPIQMTVFHLSHEVIQFHQVQLKLLCTHLMARISQLEYFHQSLSSMRKSTMNYMHLIQINLACLISASFKFIFIYNEVECISTIQQAYTLVFLMIKSF